MKISTLSLVVGNEACNAKCPYCIANLTDATHTDRNRPINKRNLQKACMLAKNGGVSTIILTGKGEPTLFPQDITDYLTSIKGFPFIELQTNGLAIGKAFDGIANSGPYVLWENRLKEWYDLGLTTIMFSLPSLDPGQCLGIFGTEYFNLQNTVYKLHTMGFTIRLCALGIDGYIDSIAKVMALLNWASKYGVAQITYRPITKVESGKEDTEIYKWIDTHQLKSSSWTSIYHWVREVGTLLMILPHGAEVYDVYGQNLCLSNCLTISSDPENMRQLIFWPNGRITYDWQHKGAILL